MKKLLLLVFIVMFIVNFSYAGIIKIVSPNGGENWEKGSVKTIIWNSTGLKNTVKLTLWRNNSLIGLIVKNKSRSGSYSWKVGTHAGGVAPIGSGYRVKIREQGGNNFLTEDLSNAPFSIYKKNMMDDQMSFDSSNKTNTFGDTFNVKGKDNSIQTKPVIISFRPSLYPLSKGEKVTFKLNVKWAKKIVVTNRTYGNKVFESEKRGQGYIPENLSFGEERIRGNSRYEVVVSNEIGTVLDECYVKINDEFKIRYFKVEPVSAGSIFVELKWKFTGAKTAWIEEVYGKKYKYEILSNYKYIYSRRSEDRTDTTILHPVKFVLMIQDKNNNIKMKEAYSTVSDKMWEQSIKQFKIAQNWRIDGVHIDILLEVAGARSIKIYEVRRKYRGMRKLVFGRDFKRSDTFVFSEKPFHIRTHILEGDSDYVLYVTWWNGKTTEKFPSNF